MAQDVPVEIFMNFKLCKTRHGWITILALSSKCGEWPYSFATFVANEKILLDIADLARICRCGPIDWSLNPDCPYKDPRISNLAFKPESLSLNI